MVKWTQPGKVDLSGDLVVLQMSIALPPFDDDNYPRHEERMYGFLEIKNTPIRSIKLLFTTTYTLWRII